MKKHQHVQSAQGKATLTEVYENFYDNAECLTKTTHSLNGSTPVILAENTYDDMGRLQSKKQHGAVETTNYSYNIRSWLKGITTTNNRFSETLYYNESSNGSIPCYNGNISAMNWKVQNDTQRGYNFHYDGLSRITAADYQNNDANSSKNYSTTYAYDNMGNIKNLTRYGLSAKPSTFGIIDDLTLSYNGNQLSSVTDASTSEPSYSGAFNFVKASSGTPEYTYDANGNLTRDSHKKIAKIQYNILNLPSALQFTEGHTSEYLYDAAGVKRKVKQVTTTENLLVPMGSMLPVPADKVAVATQTDYCGNVIYENGTLSRILFDGGYVTMNGTIPTYHYYIQDHQGNNRVVFNQNGTIEQTNHYYPFGMTFGEGIDNSDNRYKYNNKELDRMHGLDLYDYGARMQNGMRFTTLDPLAEKYYSISPYAYCMNNPIRFIDPNGLDVVYFDNSAKEIGRIKSNERFETYYRVANGKEGSVASEASNMKGSFMQAEMPGVIAGFEASQYQQLDYQIAASTAIMNDKLESLSGLPAAENHQFTENSQTPKLNVNLVKSMIMEESKMGTAKGGMGTAKADPMQANNNGDWNKDKVAVGLTKGQQMNSQISINAGLGILVLKGMNSDVKGNYTTWKGDRTAVQKYNGGGNPNYVRDVFKYLNSIKSITH